MRIRCRYTVAAAALALVMHAGAVQAAEDGPSRSVSDDGITVMDATVRAAAKAEDAAVSMRIRNDKSRLSKVVVVDSPAAARTTLHRTIDEGATMQLLPSLDIPGGGAEVVLDPADVHVMLIGLKQPLEAGSDIRLRMDFFPGPTLRVPVRVVAANGGDESDRQGDSPQASNSTGSGQEP